MAAVLALTSKFNQKSKEPVIELSKQKSVDDIFGESSVTKVKDWWLTLVDDHSEDEFWNFVPKNIDEIFEIYISKFSQKSKESLIELSKQKSVDNKFGEFLVTRVKDWWLTLAVQTNFEILCQKKSAMRYEKYAYSNFVKKGKA